MSLAVRPRASSAVLRGRKTIVFQKAAINANGSFEGYGAVFGNRDDGGDVILKGFFSEVLADFLKSGFISWGHDWDTPCAMPTVASEDNYGLVLGAAFHSDPESQRYRTIAQERLDNGLTMGLSIGYEIAAGGYKRDAEGRVLTKASRLFEVGLVMVPMNREAGATDVKTGAKAAAANTWTASYVLSMILDLLEEEAQGLDPADADYADDVEDVATLGAIRDLLTTYISSTAREVGTPEDLADLADEEAAAAMMASEYGWMGDRGLTFDQHKQLAGQIVTTLMKRASALARPRRKGRVLSQNGRVRLEELEKLLADGAGELKDLLASTGEKGTVANVAAMVEAARLNGVII